MLSGLLSSVDMIEFRTTEAYSNLDLTNVIIIIMIMIIIIIIII
jgi:hypothetical protein